LFPITGQALLNLGPALIGTFISATSLLDRAGSYTAGQTDWLEQIEQLAERQMAGTPCHKNLHHQYLSLVPGHLTFLTPLR
jgi:hypothetical protein